MAADARTLIDRLGLAPHPEGGWYRETWRGAPDADGRADGSAILFLLEPGARSHWHCVDASESWAWHAGDPLALAIAPGDAGPVTTILLGGDVLAGEAPQATVPPHHWQAAHARAGWALVSCFVVPGFDFAGFTLAPGMDAGGMTRSRLRGARDSAAAPLTRRAMLGGVAAMSDIIDCPSPNFDDRSAPVSIIVLHYTGMQDAAAAIARLTDAEAKVSSHYLVAEDGQVLRLVAEDARAWHAG